MVGILHGKSGRRIRMNETPIEVYKDMEELIKENRLTVDGVKICYLNSIAYSLAVIAEKL